MTRELRNTHERTLGSSKMRFILQIWTGPLRRAMSPGSENVRAQASSRVAGTRLARLSETGDAPTGNEGF
jgi:hypothetical protein